MRGSLQRFWDQVLAVRSAAAKRAGGDSSHRGGRSFSNSLGFEPLEPRIALAAAGLVPVGAQPTGPLTGKIVYTSAGHGWQWNTTLDRYATDRGDNNEIVEDFGNQDQMTYYADYLLRAGATVVPMRPVGHQVNEVVLDNDSSGVTYTGSWSNSTGSVYYDEDYGVAGGGNADSVSYRSSSISAAETAVATYKPNIPAAGFYPVYTWVTNGTNRTNQLYRINHSGGATELRVDHRLVGKGWVYLGTYHFDAGSGGSVQISNKSTAGGAVVIADSIRFGNGMGDVKSGDAGIGTASGVISGYRREDENSLHWLWRAVGQGNSAATVTGGGNVSAPSRMAEHMNAAAFGASVYIGFHSNAGGGRGARGLIDSDQGTPNQSSLALYTGRQINQDLQALNGVFEHNWHNGTTHTYTSGFGEIDEGASAEMDMTIIEVGFHDSVEDAQLMRDPRVRDQLARSTYEATLEYFDNFGELASPVRTPSAPINLRVASSASGQATLNWAAGPTGVYGAAATGYRIYASTNGYGFDGGTFVAGGGTTSVTLSGYDPSLPYYFKVVAVNAGGESRGSEVVTVSPDGGMRNVLIVTGFDRLDRSQNVRYPYAFTGDGLTDRVWERTNNSYDYVVQYAAAIQAMAPDVTFDAASNEAVINGSVNLNLYDTVIWILGEESTANDTFNAVEQSKVSSFLAAGGNLFLSGSEVGWDLDAQGGGASFFNSVLRADYVADDANTYTASASPGSIFAGLPAITFDNGQRFYNVDFPDRITPLGGATSAMTYSTGGSAAIQYANPATGSKLVMMAFPFETITTASLRNSVMARVLDWFSTANGDFNDDGVVDGADFLAWQRGLGSPNPVLGNGDANDDNVVNGEDLDIWRDQFGIPSAAPASAASSASLMAVSVDDASTDFADSQLISLAQRMGAPAVDAASRDRRTRIRETAFELLQVDAAGVILAPLHGAGAPSTLIRAAHHRGNGLTASRDDAAVAVPGALDSALDGLLDGSWRDRLR